MSRSASRFVFSRKHTASITAAHLVLLISVAHAGHPGGQAPNPIPCLHGGFLAVDGPHVNGKASGVSLPNDPSLHAPNGITIDASVFPTQFSFQRPITKGDGKAAETDRSYEISILPDGRVDAAFFFKQAGSSAWTSVTSNGTLTLNAWRRVTASFDSASGEARLYLDGVLESVVSMTTGGESLVGMTLRPSTVPLVVGATLSYPQTSLVGAIDEVRVWSRALSAPEVFKVGDPVYASQLGLTVFLPFDGHLFDLERAKPGSLLGTGVISGACARVLRFGVASGPAPEWSWTGSPVLGAPITFHLSNPSGTPAMTVILIGAEPAKAPAYSGSLYVTPVASLTLGNGGAGITIPTIVPDEPALAGFPAFLQAFSAAITGSSGVGVSRGLELQLGAP